MYFQWLTSVILVAAAGKSVNAGRNSAETSGYILCPAQEIPCSKSKCFNPSKQQCLKGIICDIGEKLCYNQICYNSTTQLCRVGNYNYGIYVCAREDSEMCGSKFTQECFNPKTHECLNENKVCKIGELTCGNLCFTKGNGNSCFADTLCDNGKKGCNGKCYDTNGLNSNAVKPSCYKFSSPDSHEKIW